MQLKRSIKKTCNEQASIFFNTLDGELETKSHIDFFGHSRVIISSKQV